MAEPTFDLQEAHRHFAAACFNETWAYLERSDLSATEREEMVSACHASLHHWRKRADCSPVELSIGYWLLSRVYASFRQSSPAVHYARLALERAQAAGGQPYYEAYAYEALARAAAIDEPATMVKTYLAEASRLADSLESEEEKKRLQDDLRSIEYARS